MCAGDFDSIACEIEKELLAADPDVSALVSRIAHDHGMSLPDSESLCRTVVSSLNAEYFPGLTELELVLTEACNLACSYCFESGMKGARWMTSAIATRAVDFLFEYSENGAELSITHFGGEPLLNFEVLRVATEYAERRAQEANRTVTFNATTNGVSMTNDQLDYLIQHKVGILLSIDGMRESHDRYRVDRAGRGSFDRVIGTLKSLKHKGMWIGAKMTVMPENAHRLYDDVVGLHELGVNQFLIGRASGVGWGEMAVRNFCDQYREVARWYRERRRDDLRIRNLDQPSPQAAYFGCQAARNSVTVTTDGQISPCAKVLGFNGRAPIGKLGDVFFGLTHFQNRLQWVTGESLRLACGRLGISDYTGCFASNLEETGSPFEPNISNYHSSRRIKEICNEIDVSTAGAISVTPR